MDRVDLIIKIDEIDKQISDIKGENRKIYEILNSNKKRLKALIKQSNYLISKVNGNRYYRTYISDSDDNLFYDSN